MYEWDYQTSSTTFRASESITFTIGYTVFVENIFGGGVVSVDGSTVNSGSTFTIAPGESLSLSAIEQTSGGYNRVWSTSGDNLSKWYKNGDFIAYSQSSSFSPGSGDNGAHLTAGLRTVFNPTFQNSFGGGYLTLDGSQYNSGSSISIVQSNSVTANASWQFYNGIEYTFNHWQDNNTTNPRGFQIESSASYTAYYTGKPSNSGKNFAFNGNIGDPINITWTDNQNSSVTEYQIWRRVKHNGILGDATLLATVSRGVQTYTDNEYSFTNGYTNDMLSYDVRAYYEPDGTYSDPQWQIAYGEPSASVNENSISMQTKADEVPAEYSITNYPNPFNPTTTINYQLPENGLVTIKVYDMLGKEVATLVDGNRTAGYHNVTFDASRLTSGIYIYTITANNFVQSKKMLLMK
jgi:hypothetical protein